MKSKMLSRKKQANILVSRQTLEQAVQEGNALAEKLLAKNPHDPTLDQLSDAVGRLEGALQQGEDQFDDAVNPSFAQAVKKDVDFIAQVRQQARPERIPGAPGNSALPEEVTAGAGGGADAWVTDRDQNGQAKTPERGEVPRLAAKKKKEAEPAAAAAPAPVAPPPAASGSPLDYVPTEMLLKIVQDLPKQEGFEANKGMQDALVQLTQLLQTRPVAPAKPEEGAAAPAPAPVAAPVASKTAEEEGQRHDDVPVAPTPNVFEGSGGEKAQDSKTAKVAVAPPGWEGTVKEMKKDKGIDNPYALAWSMKDKGYTPHKASFILRRRGGKYLKDKMAAGNSGGAWSSDQSKGDVIESSGRTPEVADAHGKIDEKPAKLDRPETTLPIKLASAVKDAESLGEELKSLYLKSKPLAEVNGTRPVREFVETIYKAYSLCNDAVKVLNKQEQQEKAEEEAADLKKKEKKSSRIFGGLAIAAAE